MTREGKTVTLAILTVFIYAISIFLQTKTIIFPFPLYEVIFFIATCTISFYQYKKERLLSLAFFVMASFGILSSEFFWSFFMNGEALINLNNGVTIDLFKLIKYLLIGTCFVFSFYKSEHKYIQFASIFPIAILFIALGNHNLILEEIAYLIVFIYALFHLEKYPILNLWILMFILETTKLWHLIS
ncbi:MAG: hypothetical protein HYR91_04305 [Flavobacteriia bacterium]|nr:hypothetical protein [Flavobacteriia bacterium]